MSGAEAFVPTPLLLSDSARKRIKALMAEESNPALKLRRRHTHRIWRCNASGRPALLSVFGRLHSGLRGGPSRGSISYPKPQCHYHVRMWRLVYGVTNVGDNPSP